MKNNKKRLALIIVLLIAVAAVAFGVGRVYKAREKNAGRSDVASETEQTEAEKQTEAAEQTEAEKQTEAAEQTSIEAAEESSDKTDADGLAEATKEAEGKESGADAAESLATLFFASDYQTEEGFDEPSVTLQRLLAAAEADGKSIDRAIICGDYTSDRVLQDYQLSPDEHIEEAREVIEEACPDVEAEEIIFVQGNHDSMTEEITPTGLYEYDDCLIYVLNTEDAFPWKQGKTAGCLAKVSQSSAAMKECFDELIQNGETRPVFIAGHVPLHFTARTSSRHTTGDNLYSSLIFDVVNDAAKSLDIVYLFGHNHSKGWDCYLGGSTVYKAKGDTILIPRFDEADVNTDEYSEETLEFTYMNAGYCGYYMNCGTAEMDAGAEDQFHAADETLTGTVFEIYVDRIVATRYDSEGVHVLGHAGEADPYKGGIDEGLIPEAAYSKETNSPQEFPRS